MKLPVVVTKAHKGKALQLDSERETITLLGPQGESLGSVSWELVINQILRLREPKVGSELRGQPRISLLVKVRYSTPEGKQFESRATGIGGGGLFIESNTPLPVGMELAVEFALPDRPTEWLRAKARVAWVCHKPDQYSFFPGMGVRFTDISEAARNRVVEMVHSMRQASGPS